MNGCPDHIAVRVDLVGDEGIAIVGPGKKSAEGLLGIIVEDGKEIFALVINEDRLVVGDEFRKQRDNKEKEKNPQRPEAAPVVAEIVKPAAVERRQPDKPA